MDKDSDSIRTVPDVNESMKPVSLIEKDATVFSISSVRGVDDEEPERPVVYKLYKRRFVGIFGIIMLNIVGAMAWPWFGPISTNMVTDFGIDIDDVNWLGNIVSLVCLPVSLLVPVACGRVGLRRCCEIGSGCMIIAAWVRYAGTIRSLSANQAYALLMIGQMFSAIAQPIFQVLGPKFSESWFSLEGRTTATMLIAIANPIGGAIGQLISPLVGTPRQSILILGIISTAVAPFVFLVQSAPPTPPTFSGAQPSESLTTFLRKLFGRYVPRKSDPDIMLMTNRERLDFLIIFLLFGMFIGTANAFALLSAEELVPVGYSTEISGIMGATLLLAGIIAAIVIAPIYDGVLTKSLAITVKVLAPILGASWFGFVWAVKPNNTAALFVLMVILGVSSITLLPLGLELGVEVTRNADASSAVLWFSGNVFGTIFVLADSALRAPATADPPYNMHNALLFNGIITFAVSFISFLLRGQQRRRELDEAQQGKLSSNGMHPTDLEMHVRRASHLGDIGGS